MLAGVRRFPAPRFRRRRATLAPTSIIALVAHLVAFLAPAPSAHAEAAPPPPPAPVPRPSRLLPRLPGRPGAPPAPAPAPPPPAPAPAPIAAKPAAGPAKPGAPGVVELPARRSSTPAKNSSRQTHREAEPQTRKRCHRSDRMDLKHHLLAVPGFHPAAGQEGHHHRAQLITPEEAYRLFFAALESWLDG